ncbi:hypothetical protein AWL63_23515 (plasmid) [Sphingomonas panacis]|uniref:Site-specific integrase n=2 Tax=Sphingomonas panacis TaxID=1560345 RepID=A0A1B3ZIQ2_9SPHN|nr:hypothetical protein AWL63_23515 [Sphingomonas panacis]
MVDVDSPGGCVLRFLTPVGELEQEIDLTGDGGRGQLRADIAFALRHHLADKSCIYREGIARSLPRWFEFLDIRDPSRSMITAARHVDEAVLRAYIASLDREPWAKGSKAASWSTVKVPFAWLIKHRPDLAAPGLDLPHNPFPYRNRDTPGRSILSGFEVDATLTACRCAIEASWNRFQTGRELIANSPIDVPLTSAGKLDLKDLGVLLRLISTRYEGVLPDRRSAPHDVVLSRIWDEIKQHHPGWREIAGYLHATPEVLAPYMIAIGLQTFANPEALRNFRRDCMTEHLFLNGRVLVTWEKGRAGRSQRRSFLRDRGMSVPKLIDRVLEMTAPLIPLSPVEQRDRLFLCAIASPRSVGLIAPWLPSRLVKQFVERHDIRDSSGRPSQLTIAMLRPTGLSLAHHKVGFDVLKTQIVANHADPATTKHYVDRPALRAAREAMLAGLQGRFVSAIRIGTLDRVDTQSDDTGHIDGRNATAAGFICADPLSGVAPGQREGRLCTAWLGCFTCPNAVIPLGVETLARLLKTRDALAAARMSMAPDRWRLVYAPKLEILERDILPRFPAAMRPEGEAAMEGAPMLPPIE